VRKNLQQDGSKKSSQGDNALNNLKVSGRTLVNLLIRFSLIPGHLSMALSNAAVQINTSPMNIQFRPKQKPALMTKAK
jgi:hypothetical protein